MKLGTLKDFVLAREVTRVGEFSSANISMAIKDLEMGEDYLKFGSLVFLNKNANFTSYIKKTFKKCTDLGDKIPLALFNSIVLDSTSFKGMFDIIRISETDFVKPTSEYLKNILKYTTYILDYEDLKEMISEDYILGYHKINKQKYLVWY